jgi:hypothetical protein
MVYGLGRSDSLEDAVTKSREAAIENGADRSDIQDSPSENNPYWKSSCEKKHGAVAARLKLKAYPMAPVGEPFGPGVFSYISAVLDEDQGTAESKALADCGLFGGECKIEVSW